MRPVKASGFTLIELLITVGLLAVLASLAVPSFAPVIANNQMTAGVNDMIASMQLARSEAVKRAVPVSMCRSSNSDAEPPSCAMGNGWHDGWVVFVDVDADATFDNGTDEVLRAEAMLGGSLEIKVPGAAAPLPDSLTYMESGFPLTAGTGAGRNIVFCDHREDNAVSRVINISQTGRPQARAYADVANVTVTCADEG